MRIIRNRSKQTRSHPVTSQRQLLLGLIHDADGYIDAKELYRRASNHDQSIGLATVYRNLRFFRETGLVDERRLGKVRSYYKITRSAEHQHPVCLRCNRVIEFNSPLIRELVEKLRCEQEFDVTKAELYLEEYCPKYENQEV